VTPERGTRGPSAAPPMVWDPWPKMAAVLPLLLLLLLRYPAAGAALAMEMTEIVDLIGDNWTPSRFSYVFRLCCVFLLCLDHINYVSLSMKNL
jgi:hypothetical protein